MNRTYYYVVRSGLSWAVRYDGQPESTSLVFMTQAEALDFAASSAQRLANSGYPSGVRIQGADGKFRDERTYLDDPYPSRG